MRVVAVTPSRYGAAYGDAGRRTRHAAQYFDPSSAEVSADDSAWALSMARIVVDAVERLLAADPPDLFS